MNQPVLGIIIILLLMFKSLIAQAQDTLVFSAVAGTRPTKIVGEVLHIAYQKIAIQIEVLELPGKRGNEFPVNGWESVSKDIIVGNQRGVKYAEKDTAKYEIKTQPVRNSEQLFQMLPLGKVDAIIAGSTMGLRFIKEHDLQEIVRLSPPIHISILYHYLHKKHAHLISKITSVLKEMEACESFK